MSVAIQEIKCPVLVFESSELWIVMKWNREEVCHLLNATAVDDLLTEGGNVTIVYFEDSHMRYELWLNESGAFLAADPERPVQGLPWFETSIPCNELAPVERFGMPKGIGMFASEAGSSAALCFTITRREDGRISLSGAW